MSKSKTALVTGGNRGIGFAIVDGLAQRGIKVLLASRNLDDGEQAAAKLSNDKSSDSRGDNCAEVKAVKLDLSTKNSLFTDVKNIVQQHPNIDILINNAAILDRTSFADIKQQDLLASIKINALAPFELMNFFAERMQANGYGRIVNLSSGWGASSGMLDAPIAYALSKSMLNSMTRFAAEHYSGNVKINVMCPGWVRTRMGGEDADRSPEQGAETAIWLATLDDDGPTGQFFRDKRQIDW